LTRSHRSGVMAAPVPMRAASGDGVGDKDCEGNVTRKCPP